MAEILIIDDDEHVRELLAMRLEMKGHRCRQASDGALGLALLKETVPDLVMLDMLMPTMDGLAFLRTATAELGELPPVLVLSATRVAPEEFPASKKPIQVLRKPASAAAILTAIEDILALS